MSQTSELFNTYRKMHGLKNTEERTKILEAIRSFKGHFNADSLYEILKESGQTISRATVYRTLRLFTNSGLIKETVGAWGKANYELVDEQSHHDHLICLGCGRVVEFFDEGMERLQDSVCQKLNFKPTEHFLSIRGYCSNCVCKEQY